MPRQPFGLPHLCIDSHLCRCIVQRLCVAVFMHPCITTLCDRYRASLHVVLALLVSHRASSTVWVATSVHRQPFVPLHLCNDSHLCRCIVQRLCVAVFMHPCITTLCDRYRASLHVVLALLVSHRASSTVWVATSVHRQPFVPLHLCNDSHLCRCIVQRLYVVAFMHPCITTLCDRYRASFARRACSVGFASCLVSRLGCRIVWQLSAADFKHPCLKLWAFIL